MFCWGDVCEFAEGPSIPVFCSCFTIEDMCVLVPVLKDCPGSSFLTPVETPISVKGVSLLSGHTWQMAFITCCHLFFTLPMKLILHPQQTRHCPHLAFPSAGEGFLYLEPPLPCQFQPERRKCTKRSSSQPGEPQGKIIKPQVDLKPNPKWKQNSSTEWKTVGWFS